MMPLHRYYDARINTVIFAVVSVLLAIGFYFFPLISDDLLSVDYQLDAFRYGAPFDFSAYIANIADIFRYNHFRLPNTLMPPLMLMPRILPAIVSGFAIYVLLRQGLALTGFRASFPAAVFIVVAVVFLLPWVDQLYLISFQAPYLWGAALSLWLAGRVIQRRGNVLLIFAMSWLAAFWMEAYGGALWGGFVCLSIFYKEYRTRLVYAAIAGLTFGILCCASPLLIFGHWTYWPFFEGRAIMVYPFVLINLVYLIAFLCMLPRHRGELVRPLDLLLLELAVASLVLTIYFNAGARINCFGVIVSAAGICRLFRMSDFGPVVRKTADAVAALVLALCVVHIVLVDCMCYRLGAETDYVLRHCRQEEDGKVFAPMTFREDIPWYFFQKPYYDWFSHTSTKDVFEQIYGFRINAVPEVLRDFNPASAEHVYGTAEVYMHKGQLVAPCNSGGVYVVDYGRGANLRTFCVTPFTAADGTGYVWLHPDNTWMDFMLHPAPVRMDVPGL